MLRTLFSLAFFGAIFVACAWDTVTPTNNPVNPEYPCGPRGISCGNHKCCWRGDQCGGLPPPNNQCPADMCCWIGDDGSGTYSARPPHPMVSEEEARKRP